MASILQLIFRRLLQGTLVLLLVSILSFALLGRAGGDALSALQQNPQVSAETMQRLRHIYGLDQPLVKRYVLWLANAVRGHLGDSIYYQRPVGEVIWPRWWRTLSIALLALGMAFPVALGWGLVAAQHPNSWLDRGCDALIIIGSSTPRLLLALAALALSTWVTPIYATSSLASPIRSYSVWIPALVLSIPLLALFLAQTREAIVTALARDHVRTARAKGLPEHQLLLRHVLRPALNPLISLLGVSLGSVLSGSVIVEQVLDSPGVGQLSVVAVQSRDIPVMLAVVMFAAMAVLLSNLLADLLLLWNDPRLQNKDL